MRRVLEGLALAAVGGIAIAALAGHARPPVAPDAPPPPVDVPNGTPGDSGPTRVAFLPRERLDGYTTPDRVDLYEIGRVEADTGPYADGGLLLLRVEGMRGPCKGPGCSGPFHARLIRAGGTLTYLPRISSQGWLPMLLTGQEMPGIFPEDSVANETLLGFLGRFGRLVVDSAAVVAELEVHRSFHVAGLEFRLAAHGADTDGAPDTARLQRAFRHETLGWIYVTKPAAAPQDYFYFGEEAYSTSDGEGEGVAACQDEECFPSNAFFLFRPDGTYLRYTFEPPFSVADVRLTVPGRLAPEYLYWTRSGCSDGQADYASVVAPGMLDASRLRAIGTIERTGDTVLGLADPGDPYARAFYDRFTAARNAWTYGEEPAPLTFAEFTAELPFLFWQDPFGRLIRFTNAAYVPPLTCEPVVYLYPPTERRVEVRLGGRVRVLRAAPAYHGAWRVEALSDGSLRIGGERHPYLFWEGIAGLLPRPAKGFIVPRSDVEAFFRRTLARLGLATREVEDFLTAWLPVFDAAPYYRIGFYDQATVDRYAPLEVEPAPATVIRVLFDYQALPAPVPVTEPRLPPPPERRGFTVVEWGGVKR